MDGSMLHINRSEIPAAMEASILIDHGLMDRIIAIGNSELNWPLFYRAHSCATLAHWHITVSVTCDMKNNEILAEMSLKLANSSSSLSL